MSTSPQTFFWFFWVTGKQLYQLISVPFSKYSVLNGCAVAQISLPAMPCKGFWSRGARRWEISWGKAAQSGPALAKLPKCLVSSARKSMHTQGCEPNHRSQIRFSSKNHQQPKLAFPFLMHFISQTLKEVGGYLAFLGSEELPDLRCTSQRLCLHRPCTESNAERAIKSWILTSTIQNKPSISKPSSKLDQNITNLFPQLLSSTPFPPTASWIKWSYPWIHMRRGPVQFPCQSYGLSLDLPGTDLLSLKNYKYFDQF